MTGGDDGWGRMAPRGGRVVPVYAVTGGRTRATDGPDLPIEALVTVTEVGVYATDLQLEYRAAVELAATPVSIAEIGASLGVPIGVARGLVSDLVNAKYLVVHLPPVPSAKGDFECRDIPFVVAVNRFPGADEHDAEAVGDALTLPADCPVIWMDARDSRSSRETLVGLVEHALARTAVTT